MKPIVKDIDTERESLQYSLSPIPAHVHDGTDSLQVSFLTLTDVLIPDSFTIPGASAATATNYSVFFIASQDMRLMSAWESHTTAGVAVGAVTVNIEKLSPGDAPGSGTDLLAAGFNLKGTINTPVQGTLIPDRLEPNLLKGDRLALHLTGTPTTVANVTFGIVMLLL